MDPNTGEIYGIKNNEHLKQIQRRLGRRLVPLSGKEAIQLKPLSKRRRLFLLKGKPCLCLSGKSFKKCCWKKYKQA